MRLPRTAALTLALATLLPGCFGGGEDAPPPLGLGAPEPLVHLATSMGNITIGLYEEMVPLTATRFAGLAADGSYAGASFTRVSDGKFVQAGRPTRTDFADPTSQFLTQDEFHAGLRHDRAGLVSMLTNDAATGNTEFFITLAADPSLDDRYSLFGHVVAGMDVVEAIAAVPANGTTLTPLQPVTIRGATVERPSWDGYTPSRGVQLQATTASKALAPGASAWFALVVTNTGTARDVYTLSTQAPEGWSATFSNPKVALPAGRSWVMLLNVTPSAGFAAGPVSVTARSDGDASAAQAVSLDVQPGTFGPPPAPGQTVRLEYTGLLEDGRIFDTTRADLGEDTAFVKMSSAFRRSEETYGPYEYTVGAGVVAGFDSLVQRTQTGETSVGPVPAWAGYTDRMAGNDLLFQRNLYFEVRLL